MGAILFFALFTAAGQKPTASEAELRKQADKHFAAGNFVQATPMYSQLLSLFPLDPVLNYRYGVSLMEAGKEKSTAVLYLDFAVRNPPVPDDAWLYLGRSHMMAGNFSKAADALNKFKSTPSASKSKKTEIDLLLANCNHAQALQADRKNIAIINSQEIKRQNFHTSYDYSTAPGKIVPTADQFLTTQDKDKQINPVMFMSRDAQTIFYSSYGRGSSSGKDIYRVRKMVNGQWGTPENLGAILNSAEHEDYPFLDRDGRTLYFSSRGHSSIGGYDLFRSVYDFNTNQWSQPENLGIPLNTAADEFLYIPEFNSDQAVYYTNFESNVSELIKRTISTGNQGGKFAVVTGTYYSLDQATRRDARISVLRASDKAVVNSVRTDPKSGKYELVLPPGEDYTLLVEGGGYLPHAENFSLPDLAVSGMRQEVKLNKDKSREQMTVSNFFTPVSVKEGEASLAFRDTPTEVSTSILDLSENDSTGKVPVRIDDQVIYVKDPAAVNESADRTSLPVEARSVADYGFNEDIESSDDDEVAVEDKKLPGIKLEAKDRYDPTLAERLSDDEIRQMEEEKERAMIIEEEEKNPNMIVDINIDNDELAQIALEDAQSLESDAESMKLRAELLKANAASQDSLALTLDEDAESVAKTDPQKKDELLSRSSELKESALAMNREASSLLLQASIKMDESRSARRDAEAILRSLGRGDEIAQFREKDDESGSDTQSIKDVLDSSFPVEGESSDQALNKNETQLANAGEEVEFPEQIVKENQPEHAGTPHISENGIDEESLGEGKHANIRVAELALKNDQSLAERKADGHDAVPPGTDSTGLTQYEVKADSVLKSGPLSAAERQVDQPALDSEVRNDALVSGHPESKSITDTPAESKELKNEPVSETDSGVSPVEGQAGRIAIDRRETEVRAGQSIAMRKDKPSDNSKKELNVTPAGKEAISLSETLSKDSLLATAGQISGEDRFAQSEMQDPVEAENTAFPDSLSLETSGLSLSGNQTLQHTSDSISFSTVNEENDIKKTIQDGRDTVEGDGPALASMAEPNRDTQGQDIQEQSVQSHALNSDPGHETPGKVDAEQKSIALISATEEKEGNSSIQEEKDSFAGTGVHTLNTAEADKTIKEKEGEASIPDTTPSDIGLSMTEQADIRLGTLVTGETVATSNKISNELSSRHESIETENVGRSSEYELRKTDTGTVQYNSGRTTAFLPETHKAEIQDEARVIYEAFESNVKSSEKLFNQSRTLQERILEMPRSPERDSLVEVSNALSRESSMQFTIAQSQLEDAIALDSNLSLLLIPADAARIAALNESSDMSVSEHTVTPNSDTAAGLGMKTVQEDSQTEMALSTRTTTTIQENINQEATAKSAKMQMPLSRAVEENKLQTADPIPQTKVSDLEQPNSEGSENDITRTQASAGVQTVRPDPDNNTGQHEESEVSGRQGTVKAAAQSEINIQEKDDTGENATAAQVEVSAEGLDVNHPKYPEYKQVQEEITSSQVETINLFAEGVNLNKKSVEEKQRQVDLLDSAQKTDDEVLRAQLLTSAADLAYESERHQEESVAKLAMSQKKTHEVKALTAKMEDLKKEISTAPGQNKDNLASVPNVGSQIPNNTGPNAISLTEKRASMVKEGTAVNKVPDMSVDELAEFSSIKYGNKQGPAYSKVNPIPLDPGLPDGLVFKIQIGAFRRPIADDSFRNLQPISAETSRPGWLRYCVGMFKTFEPANLVRKELRKGEYKDAFVVVYYNGKRISLQEANSILDRQGNQTAYLGEMRKEISALNQLDVIKSARPTTVRDEDEKMFYGNSSAPHSSIQEAFGPLEYTVQVGVYRNEKPPSVLAVLEPIYTESIKDGLYRFTSGRYEQRSEAERAKRMAIDAGVSDAFVTTFRTSSSKVESAPVPAYRVVGSEQLEAVSASADSRSKGPEAISYRVQLGAFRQNVPLEMVDAFLSISDKGIVRISDERGLNIFYAGNFSTYEEARSLKDEIISKGVQDAFVVSFSGTKRIPLSSAMPAE